MKVYFLTQYGVIDANYGQLFTDESEARNLYNNLREKEPTIARLIAEVTIDYCAWFAYCTDEPVTLRMLGLEQVPVCEKHKNPNPLTRHLGD